MKHNFKKGNKVKIPTRKTGKFPQYSQFKNGILGYKYDYLIVQKVYGEDDYEYNNHIYLIGEDNFRFNSNVFYYTDLEPYNEVLVPELIMVKGSTSLLQAMWEELGEMGYDLREGGPKEGINQFGTNNCDIATALRRKRDYIQLYADADINMFSGGMSRRYDNTQRKEFNLPTDYQACLDYCKAAINSPFWDKEEVRELHLGTDKIKVVIQKDMVVAQNGALCRIEELKALSHYIETLPNAFGHATYIDNTARVFSFGCGEGGKFSINEIQQVINAHRELNTK